MSECVLWKGCVHHTRYGVVQLDGRQYLVHRVFYMLYHGPIPARHVVHHVCENKLCVNPAHLTVMPRPAHTSLHRPGRGKPPATHCKRGHAFTPENTYHELYGGRRCVKCRRLIRNTANARRRTAA